MKLLPRNYLLPHVQDIFFIALFLAVLLLGNRMLNLDGDLPRHLLMGKYIVETRHIATTEQFIYPYLHRPYVTHEWLADVALYGIYRFGGLGGIVLFSAITLATTFTLLFNSVAARSRSRLGAFLLVMWGALATSLNSATRPHLISMLFLVLLLIWAEKLRSGQKIPVWHLPAFFLLWSNVHGEFIAGILVLSAYAFGWLIDRWLDKANSDREAGRRLWLALVLSALASLLNPGGVGPWVSILGFVNNKYLMSRMLESNPPNFQAAEVRVLLGLIVFSVFLLAIKKVSMTAGQGLLAAGFTAMSLIAFRNIHLYGVVIPFALADSLGTFNAIPILSRLENSLDAVEKQIKGSIWIAATTLGMGVLVLTSQTAAGLYQFNPSTFPVAAVDWLETNPQEGRMFNELNWGGYISFRLYPGQSAFVDSVADVTGDVTLQYETVSRQLPGWENVLQQHDIQWAIIRAGSPFAVALQGQTDWDVLYEDETAMILRRR